MPTQFDLQQYSQSDSPQEIPCTDVIVSSTDITDYSTKERLFSLINRLGLQPHPEGGFYKETLRLDAIVAPVNASNLPTKERLSAGTSIYFLLESEQNGSFSAWHRLDGLDEVWNYHTGAPVNISWITPDGTLVTRKLGLVDGASPQVHVPRNCWFSAVVDSQDPTAFSLMGCTVFPGFDFSKFELAERTTLSEQFPQHAELIERFTR